MFCKFRHAHLNQITAIRAWTSKPALSPTASIMWPSTLKQWIPGYRYSTSAGNAVGEKPRAKHFNDWPNSQGFDTDYEETTPVELQIEGYIPSYVAGTLFRTGPGPRTIDCQSKGIYQAAHWFDGFAQVHRFQIHPPNDSQQNQCQKVTYNSRLVCDGTMNKIRETGQFDGYTFAAKYEPCKSLFQKFQTFWKLPNPAAAAPNEVHVNVTMSVNFPGLESQGKSTNETSSDDGKINTLWTKTDSCQLQSLDPDTLEPMGLAVQSILHPDLKGPISAAHAKSDPLTGDVYNFNLEFGRTGTYRIFVVSASTGETNILATLEYPASYMHSFWLTENYVILCAWNSYFKSGGTSILWNKNILDSLGYDESYPAKWFVIDKRPESKGGKGILATYESDPFFAFHSINAFEEKTIDGKTDILADIPAYQGLRC